MKTKVKWIFTSNKLKFWQMTLLNNVKINLKREKDTLNSFTKITIEFKTKYKNKNK